MTGNHRKWLEEAERQHGEPIEAIVIGRHDNAWSREDSAAADENVILDRATGLAKLDYDYPDGFGGADCHPFYAWTKSRVFFVHEYDGSTALSWVPRNPTAGAPAFTGE